MRLVNKTLLLKPINFFWFTKTNQIMNSNVKNLHAFFQTYKI